MGVADFCRAFDDGRVSLCRMPNWIVYNSLWRKNHGEPLISRVLDICEGTTPMDVVGATTKMRAPTPFHLGTFTHVLHQCCCVNLRPSLLPYLLKHLPPAVPFVISPHRTTGPSKSTSTSSMRIAQQLAVLTSGTYTTSPMPNANGAMTMAPRLTAIIALFVFVIMAMTTPH